MTEFRFFSSEVRDDVLVLTLNIDTLRDYVEARDLGNEFEAAAVESGKSHVVVNMKRLTYLTSVGIWPLLGLRHQVREQGGAMALCELTQFVETVLMKTHLLVNPKARTAPFLNAATVDDAITLLTSS